MAGAFHFPILAPPIVKKGESVRIILGTIPASPLPPAAGSETIDIWILDPSGRVLPQNITVNSAIAGATYTAFFYFNYVFGSNGTFTIFAKVSTPPVPDIYLGCGVVHVPAWLDNIDKPISDIAKSNTEISRLRTQYDRAKSGGI